MTTPRSHLDGVVYPRTGFTRGDVVAYYDGIAAVMLPHLRGRTATVVRFADGVAGPCELERGEVSGLRLEAADSLAAAAAGGALEFRAPATLGATAALDLRARGRDALQACCTVACWLSDALAELDTAAFVVTDGANGLQVRVLADDARSAGRRLLHAAGRVAARHPRTVTTAHTASLGQRVLADVRTLQPGVATRVPYTLRAGARPSVAAPLRFHEVVAAADGVDTPRLGPHEVLGRVELDGDLLVQPAVAAAGS